MQITNMNKKKNNIERLAEPLLSPNSNIGKYKNFESISAINQNLRKIIQKAQFMDREGSMPRKRVSTVTSCFN